SRYTLASGAAPTDLTAPTPQILLCTAGTVTVGEIALKPGESAYVPADERVEATGPGTLFRATVAA
ncbi:mannose-6-phosphate isomerase, class I, partial [Streptomyces sp. MBT61]|nr:mannose-6-phosphate isomerase, class I [Streptomyces sp. MBT61]